MEPRSVTEMTDSLIARAKRISNHLQANKSDYTLLILKGHILLDETITEILCETLRIKMFPEEVRLAFRQKCLFLRSIANQTGGKSSEKSEEVIGGKKKYWTVIDEFSKLRNKVAHNILKEEAILDEILEYVNANKSYIGNGKALPDHHGEMLISVISTLYNFLCGLRARLFFQRIEGIEA